jgi:3'-phosphoadenosine 5'-phosphosulfate synthase
VARSLVQQMTPQERTEFAKLPSLHLDDIEQVEYIHTIAEGWAYPLKRFMNEQELIESLNMNTVTCEEGKRHILSVPITQYLTGEQKSELEGHSKIALKWADEVLAVIEEPEFFDNRKEEISTKTFGTAS